MSNKKGRISAFVLGLIAGIIHGILGMITALLVLITGGITNSFFSGYLYGFGNAVVAVGIVIFIIALLNLIGGCIARSSRIAGGVLMIITAIPILVISIYDFTLFFLTITGLMSLAAAILAFIPYSNRYKQAYAMRKQKKNGGQQPYGQQQYQQQPYGQQPYGQQPPQQQYQKPPQQQYQQPPTAPPVASPAAPPPAAQPVIAKPVITKPEDDK